MLIYLTNSLIIDPKDSSYNNIRIAIRNIAWAVIESKHILRGDYEILCSMRDLFKSDIDIFPLFRKLCLEYSTHTIPNIVTNYVEVVKENPTDRRVNVISIKQVTYEYFMDSIKVQPMNLILEDDDDDIIYRLIVNWYIQKNNLKTNIAYTNIHGGGGNVVDVVKKYIRKGLMAICITDSDMHFPGQTIKRDSSSSQCQRLHVINGIYYHHTLDVQEMENLIPLNYIDNLDWHFEQNKQDKKAFDKLRNSDVCEEILTFFDYKEGIKKSMIEDEVSGKDKYCAYAKLCCEQYPELMGNRSFEEYYANLDRKDYVYPRLKKRIMPEIKEFLENGVPEPSLMNFQKKEWEKIGNLLMNLFCARSKESLL